MPNYFIGECAIIPGRRRVYCTRDDEITTIIVTKIESFVAIIIIFTNNFALKLQYFENFCNIDDYCNERKNLCYYNESHVGILECKIYIDSVKFKALWLLHYTIKFIVVPSQCSP